MTVTNHKPKHTVQRRSLLNYQGEIHHLGCFVRSGSISGVAGSTTGSAEMNFDAVALRLRRIEVFHSGAATAFNILMENKTPNTGSLHDQRCIVTCYNDVPGWGADGGSTPGQFDAGIDQIEDMVMLTDHSTSKAGNLYLKVAPFGSGNNDFKYLLFFEAVFLYETKDGGLNG